MTAQSVRQALQEKLDRENFDKLMALDSEKLHKFVADAIELTKPASVLVCTDKPQDADYVRQLAIKNGEEIPLATKGHTYHFDGINDQGRDKFSTRYLLPDGWNLGSLESIPKKGGVEEVRQLLKDIMVGRQMLVCFWCLGPADSDFTIPCVQITDSPYVAHSESMLYRPGYEQFKKIGNSPTFFRFLHSEGELDNGVSKNWEKRRVYIDLEDEMVYSVNTQYAGNTVGLKKLALRLAIQKADRDGDWLAEHMFVMGVHGPHGRITYFSGAFPSGCGKTSTAMISGQTIVGDDLAYFRKKDGNFRAANIEKGIFGIIENVNGKDDPVIYEVLTKSGEVIFSNVLIGDDKKPYWMGMGQPLPDHGLNYAGNWKTGDKDAKGGVIHPSHKNARYTISLSDLANRDPLADAPQGVPVGGVIYGGRDSDTWVPVEQAFDWTEGIIAKGASLESETTATVIGATGARAFNLMSNIDFLSIPMGKYIMNNVNFAKDLKKVPMVFSVNYFLKNKDGKYLNGMLDKRVWILWAELRINGDVKAIKTPTGFIPKYEDLAKLFKSSLNAEYTQAQYVEQFTVRVKELLAKIDRIEKVYRAEPGIPQLVFDTFDAQRKRLKEAQEKYGDNISPFDLESK
ncbi:MAG TPA: phosphoenolpyruvate carboxykinase (GTP) [Phycisphaerales bacterium]|nr:phosphoenolpyruvate carboxykinase (GTP) [Phycisphaerales bacterium]HBR20088.1 phosphoenolpyruvate carboxykinase (GTP) [Phycisphaerales bacterium]